MKITTNDGEWCNNAIGKKLNLEYPHDFSLCDIDGVCRTAYTSGSLPYTRFVIYESKYTSEQLSRSQLVTLTRLSASIDWSEFDTLSGVFVFRHDDTLDFVSVYRVTNYSTQYLGRFPFTRLYQWVAAKDKRSQ